MILKIQVIVEAENEIKIVLLASLILSCKK